MEDYNFILTRQGLLLIGDMRSAYYSNEIQFRRFAEDDEADYLKSDLKLPQGSISLEPLSILDDKLSVTFGQWELDREPKDWSKSNNGGDYATYTMDVMVNGQLWGQLLGSSCDINHCCEITGSITQCERVEVLGEDFSFMLSEYLATPLSEWKDGTKFCTLEEFLGFFCRTTRTSEEDRPNRTERGGRR